jgi:hypothetical protein
VRVSKALRIAVLGLAIAAPLIWLPSPSSADVTPPAFQGTASAIGVEITEVLPGFPASNSPFDGGGPTAQAQLDSLGTSEGYAAFPDPGALAISVPGLVAGLLSLGAGGLPPLHIPTLPPYPLYVQSSATTPHPTIGAGPYQLRANSGTGAVDATATAGLQGVGFGNAALVTSTASMQVQPDGSVVSTATSDVQGATIGPLAIGEIKATATETLSPGGALSPSSAIAISGVRIAGLPVSIDTSGLDLPGPTIALPINDTLAKLLRPSGLTVTVVKPQVSAGRVVAPALQISGPATIPGISTGPGGFTITIGSTSAALGTPTGSAPINTPSPSSHGSVAAAPPAAGLSTSTGVPLPTSVGTPSAPNASPPVASAPLAAQSPAAVVPQRIASVRRGFDIRSLYIVLVTVAFAVWLLGQVFRLVGVRGPWTSISG